MLCDNILPNLNISRLVIDRLYTRVSHSGGTWGGAPPLIQRFFFWNPRPSKPMPHMGHPPPINNEVPPSEKQPSPPLKREAPFHEMIPRKITINSNLKSSSNPWKVCLKKFIFSKFAGLQVYSGLLFYQMNSITGIFRQHFKPHMLPPCIDLSSPPIKYWRAPPMFSTSVGNPVYWCKNYL